MWFLQAWAYVHKAVCLHYIAVKNCTVCIVMKLFFVYVVPLVVLGDISITLVVYFLV